MLLDAPARGLQTPPYESIPAYVSSAGDEAVELAAMAGLILDPWQQYVLKHALGERADGNWSAFEVGLLVSRQNGKGSLAEARELAGLFLLNERLILHTAHIFKTALEGFRRILDLIESTPDLDRRVKRVVRSHGEEGIELKTGQRLLFLARSSGSGRGFSGDCVILDEAMFLGYDVMDALMPTLSARPNPQLWYMSSAGGPESTQLARVVRRGRAGGDPSLAYFEWAISESDPPDAMESWAKANPGLGIRITPEHISRELLAMDPAGFARERLGVGSYAPEEGDGWSVISEGQWNAAVDPLGKMEDPVTFAIAVNQDRSFATIAAAGKRPDGMRQVSIVAHEPGTGWVVNRMKLLVDKWKPKGVAIDAGGPEGSLIADLKLEGITPFELSARDLAQASGSFRDAVTNDVPTLRHRDQPELRQAIKKAKKRPLSEAWAWNRRDAPSVSPLIAATVALHASSVIPDPQPADEVFFLN